MRSPCFLCKKEIVLQIAMWSCGLAHDNLNSVMCAVLEYRQDIAFNCLAVNCNRNDTLANVVRVLDCYIIGCTTILSGNREAIPFVRDRRVDLQTIPIRDNTQNVLGNSDKVPCCCTSQPAVLCFAVAFRILAGNHLCIDIRLGAVEVRIFFFAVCRRNLAVVLKCLIAVANKCFCTDNPCIVVAEDTGIFFITARIGGDFAVLDVVFGKRRLVQNQAVFRYLSTLSSAFRSAPVSLPQPPITAKPWGSMKILPSSHS